MIEYPIGESGQVLVLSDQAVAHISAHRQLRFWQAEAGGQLFALFEPRRIIIEHATGPRARDRRSRTSYVPDRRAEQTEIEDFFAQGYHYVGDWHTHPEPIASPSFRDNANMLDCFRKSKHALNAFVLIIAGQKDIPESLHVSLHDGDKSHALRLSRRLKTTDSA